jgi:hypothetical protein
VYTVARAGTVAGDALRPSAPGAAVLVLALAVSVWADDAPLPARGPAEIRDEHVFAQPRLTLPAVAPWTTQAGRWSFEASVLWSNSFSWDQDVPGEDPAERRYLVDAETVTLDATARRGLTKSLDVAVRVPLRWRGGGVLDGIIDWWHRLGGFPDGNRPDFRRDAFRVEGRTRAGEPFSWTERPGAGIGNAEVEARWRIVDLGPGEPAVALLARLALPTATGPFAGNGVGGGLQAVLRAPLGRRFDLYAGVGGTAQDPGPVRGVEYETARAHGFLAIEWRPGRRLSLVAETDAASRLVRNVDRYPGEHWYLNVAGRIDVGVRTRLDLGFTENLKSQLSTTDFALYARVAFRP